MLSEEELQHRLFTDLQKLRLPVDEFAIVIRPYSKTFYGRYFPEYNGKIAEVRVYPYKFKKPNLEFYKRVMLDFNISSGIMIGNDYECDVLPAKEIGLGSIFIRSNITPYEPNYWKRSDLDYFDKKQLIDKILSFYK